MMRASPVAGHMPLMAYAHEKRGYFHDFSQLRPVKAEAFISMRVRICTSHDVLSKMPALFQRRFVRLTCSVYFSRDLRPCNQVYLDDRQLSAGMMAIYSATAFLKNGNNAGTSLLKNLMVFAR